MAPENHNNRPAKQVSSLSERFPQLEVLSADPENAQIQSRAALESYLTSREEHYIRNHHRTPDIDATEWTISLTGIVDEELELSVADIKHDYSTESVVHMMECSGNGRAYFDPETPGDQWTYGAVGNAIWTGTPVREILTENEAETDEGLWLSVMGGEAVDDEDVFCRSIPMTKIVENCLLAYEMNGAPLAPEHGYPIRLLVPGWFGNNSVKWVDRLHVMEQMVAGEDWESRDGRDYTEYQQSSYRIVPEQDHQPEEYSSIDRFGTYDQMQTTGGIRNAYLFDQLVKSIVTSFEEGATLSPSGDRIVEVTGVAWSGDDAVECVEVSTDGGETWHDVEFVGPDLGRHAVRKFRYAWNADAGEHTICSRATDEEGRTQPAQVSDPERGLRGIEDDEYPWNQKGYGNNAYEPLGVSVTVE